MDVDKDPVYRHWNGKNPEGTSTVGSSDMITEGPRDTKTGAKYDVGIDTVSADELQKPPVDNK